MNIFPQQFSVAESCMRGSLFMQFLSMTISRRHISQGRVATRLRCGGSLTITFVANLSLSLTVKEFWKSVKIWQSYHREFGGPVFLEHSVSFHDDDDDDGDASVMLNARERCPAGRLSVIVHCLRRQQRVTILYVLSLCV